MKKWPRLHLPIQVVVCTACFGLALPVSIALFPQTSEVGYYAASSSLVTWYLASEIVLRLRLLISCMQIFFLLCIQIAVADLEPELQQRTTKTILFYNKGL